MKTRLIILFILFLTHFQILLAQEPAKKILVIHLYHVTLPWTVSIMEGLANAKKQHNIECFNEYLDTVRLSDSISKEKFMAYIKEKYKSITFDAVIADSNLVNQSIAEYGGFLGDIPRVFYTGVAFVKTSNTYCLVSQYREAIIKTIDLALLQNPGANKLVIIDSKDPSSDTVKAVAEPYIAGSKGIEYEVISNYAIDELYERVGQLPSNAIVLFTPVVSDTTGKFFIPRHVLSNLTKKTHARIYTLWSSLMNTGVIGGHMIDGSATAEEMVRAAMDYIKNGAFKDDYNNLKTIIDWNAIKAHGIDTRTIPSNAILLNKPESIFVTHFREVMTGIVVVIVIFLITALFWVWSISRANNKLKVANLELDTARSVFENLAMIDTLTGLSNRRAIMPLITHEMNQNKRYGNPVSLLVIDIDHFKQFNDTHGHDYGDLVLEMIAKNLSSSCRNTDAISRWGGEEFLILASNTKGENALILAEKIRLRLSELEFPNGDKLTVSIGVSEYKQEDDFQIWFRRADSALYQAKSEGRNRSIYIPSDN